MIARMREHGRLDGRTVLITGAAGGIGAACAHGMAAEGAARLADLDAVATSAWPTRWGSPSLAVT
jgi:3-hydroxybutyrate dehydrogenase